MSARTKKGLILGMLCSSAAALLIAACGGGAAGTGSDALWYYHFMCNGDTECQQLNFTPNNDSSGTSSQGPGAGGQSGCNSLMNFGRINWNIPPAQQWCDNSPSLGTPPAVPASITGVSPTSGEAGTPITITGSNFPVGGAGITVKVGDAVATIGSVSSTQLVITLPALAGGTYAVTVTTSAGTATATQSFTVTVPMPLGNASIKKIAAGVDHVCAILANDTVSCWGGNQSGQLGGATTTPTTAAVAVAGLANAIDIAAGNAFSCAVVEASPGAGAGSVMCWGNGTLGQLGNNAFADSSTPVAVASLSTVTQISAKARHACALLSSGQVSCWGDGGSGQLGNGATSNSAVPVAVQGTGPDNYAVVNAQTGEAASTKAFQVSTGNSHSCARVSTSNGSPGLGVKCWGATNFGELGNGAPFCQAGAICDPKGPNPSPQRVGNLNTAAHIAAGGGHTCAILTSGSARCWGYGDQGQLGNGASLRSNTPVTVSGLSGATHASAGSLFSCASANAALQCWGAGDIGQLGNGARSNSATPVTVTAIGALAYDPATLTGGNLETCMKRTDATAFCFP
ncbi:MAG: IPT/TIG domain-containing protein [Burkholderiaceae bacterium]